MVECTIGVVVDVGVEEVAHHAEVHGQQRHKRPDPQPRDHVHDGLLAEAGHGVEGEETLAHCFCRLMRCAMPTPLAHKVDDYGDSLRFNQRPYGPVALGREAIPAIKWGGVCEAITAIKCSRFLSTYIYTYIHIYIYKRTRVHSQLGHTSALSAWSHAASAPCWAASMGARPHNRRRRAGMQRASMLRSRETERERERERRERERERKREGGGEREITRREQGGRRRGGQGRKRTGP